MNMRKCRYVLPSLECTVGGFGNIDCLDARMHSKCEHKKKLTAN
jgi:hypothetical protein